MIDSIQPAKQFRLCVSNRGSWLRPGSSDAHLPGLTAYEIRCTCLDRLAGTGGSKPRLRHFGSIHEAGSGSGKYAGHVVGVALDQNGQACLSVRRFPNVVSARSALERACGDWLVARVEGGSLRPRLAHVDPFTQEVPLCGSRVAYANGELTGPFVGDPQHFDYWVLDHFPSGYYAACILARSEVIDNGSAAGPSQPVIPDRQRCIRDAFAFCRYQDGHVRLEHVCSDADAARERIGTNPGLWLLTELADTVPML
ncbi:hypothetical protein IV102_13945 [bacterium]|nr:hypothetical protein [bacterium]